MAILKYHVEYIVIVMKMENTTTTIYLKSPEFKRQLLSLLALKGLTMKQVANELLENWYEENK